MSKFFSAFAAMLKKSSFATETVETVSGSKITIEAAGDVMAIGDKVFDSEGNVHPDGEVHIKVDDAILVLVIENGVIKEVKPSDEEEIKRETRSERIPEELATSMQAMEASIAALSASIEAMAAQFSRVTGKPSVPVVKTPVKETKLSKEAVAEAAKRFYKK